MQKKEIEAIIRKLQEDIHLNTKEIEKGDTIERLKVIAQSYNSEDKVISFEEIARNIKSNPDELKMMSSWGGLDELLQGFRLQQLVVVSALTKSGKTSWLMDLTSRMADHNPLWFPFEESAEELIRKFIERGQTPPKGFTPQTMLKNTIDWLELKIIEAIVKYDTKIVIIDQLDFIVEMSGDNHSIRIGETMRKLKGLAKKLNVCIFIICHLIKTKMDTQPTLEDLKGSSSIGQEADTVILLWREMKREGGQVVITDNVNISIQANRRTGKTGNVKMIYRDGLFIESDWETIEEANHKAHKAYESF